MANPRGTFAPELLPEGWFDETLRPEGWFSQDFLEPPSGGGVDATANGTTVSEVYSLIAGAASGQSNATANGVTLTEAYSFIAGSASGQSNATAAGKTLSEVYSFLPGAASGGTAATANGVTVSYVYSFVAGLASGDITLQEPQFIGDGVYRGHERAAQERTESRDKLKEIVARAYDKVVGVKPSVASPQEVPKATKSQKRNIASRVFTEIKTEGLLDALENIGELIAQYEQSQRQSKQMYDDDLMMVMMLA